MKPAIIGLIVILVIVVAGVALWQAKKPAMQTAQPTPSQASMKIQTSTAPQASTSASPTSATSTTSAMQEGTEKDFTVTGQNYSFTPNKLTVSKGDKVKITFKNSGGFHDLVIDEFNVSTKKIQSGEEDTVTFTADRAGSFQYYCSVDGHRSMGMWGTLTVK